MPKFDSPLNNIQIASPCSADWDAMYGDDRKRFCGDCKLNVYNLSDMTREEAERLVTNSEGRLCVRFWQRRDGTLITQDCPVGWAKLKARTRIYATAIASLLMALFSGVLFVSLFSKNSVNVGKLIIPFVTPTPQPLMGAVANIPGNREIKGDIGPTMGKPMMGNYAVPTPTPAKQTERKISEKTIRSIVGETRDDS